MLYRKITAVCFQIHTRHVGILCGQKVELLNVKLVVSLGVRGLISAVQSPKFQGQSPRFNHKPPSIHTLLLHHSGAQYFLISHRAQINRRYDGRGM